MRSRPILTNYQQDNLFPFSMYAHAWWHNTGRISKGKKLLHGRNREAGEEAAASDVLRGYAFFQFPFPASQPDSCAGPGLGRSRAVGVG
jgi:hypothetical protein